MFSFAWPWLFLCLPLPWFFYRKLAPAMPQQSALKTPFFAELQKISAQQNKYNYYKTSRTLALLAIWLLVISAAARPQSYHLDTQLPTDGRALFLAVDISNSMLIKDIGEPSEPLSRLEFVKAFIYKLIEQRPGDRLGLILFASQPYLQSPLTHDHVTLSQWLNDAQPGMAGEHTAIGDAIGLAIKKLRQSSSTHNVLVLITDGANNSGVIPPLTAAKIAAEQGLKIYTIGIGATADEQGTTAQHDLDEPLLQSIAVQTRGKYFRLQRLEQLPELLTYFEHIEPSAHPTQSYRIHELYPWPLTGAVFLALILALLSFIRFLYNTLQLKRRLLG